MKSPARYIQIVEELSAKQRRLERPLRLPDEHTLAAAHNVSRDTIRRALKLLEEQEAVVRRPSRGTFLQPIVARPTSLKGKAIGFVPPRWADSTTEWYTSTVFSGISKWADEQHCHISVLHANSAPDTHSDDEWIERVRERGLAGLIWLQPQSQQIPLVMRTSKILPVVIAGREVPDSKIPCVMPDLMQAAELIDCHLVGMGHTAYSVVGTDILSSYSQKWIEAVDAAYAKRGARFEARRSFVDARAFYRPKLASLLVDHHEPGRQQSSAYVLTNSTLLGYLIADSSFRDSIGTTRSIVAVDYGQYPMQSYWLGRKIDHVTCQWPKIGRRAAIILGNLVTGEVVPTLTSLPVTLVAGDTTTDYRPAPQEAGEAPHPDKTQTLENVEF